jgi:hypothetical protein
MIERPNYKDLVKAAARAGHIDPEWLASCIFHAVKSGMSIDDAIEQWRRAQPEKFGR